MLPVSLASEVVRLDSETRSGPSRWAAHVQTGHGAFGTLAHDPGQLGSWSRDLQSGFAHSYASGTGMHSLQACSDRDYTLARFQREVLINLAGACTPSDPAGLKPAHFHSTVHEAVALGGKLAAFLSGEPLDGTFVPAGDPRRPSQV